jgi:hypothetical protein
MSGDAKPDLVSGYKLFSPVLTIIIAFSGVTVLVGRVFDIPLLRIVT